MSDDIEIIPVGNSLRMGEGPHWDADKQMLYYVNIFESEVHSYCPATDEHYWATVGGDSAVTFIVPIANEHDKFIISYGGDLEIIKWDGRSSRVSRQPYLNILTEDGTRFNDGKASPSGVLFAGSMACEEADGYLPPGQGKLFAIRNGKPKLLLDKIGIGNGLAWNHDETKLYFNDTLTDKTTVFDYDQNTCNISNERMVLDYIAENLGGRPDGMAIDLDGNLWMTCFGASLLFKCNPSTGKITQRIKIPSANVTSVVFGGPTCEDLYVTTASHRIPQEKFAEKPYTGYVFKVVGTGARGYPGVPVKL